MAYRNLPNLSIISTLMATSTLAVSREELRLEVRFDVEVFSLKDFSKNSVYTSGWLRKWVCFSERDGLIESLAGRYNIGIERWNPYIFVK